MYIDKISTKCYNPLKYFITIGDSILTKNKKILFLLIIFLCISSFAYIFIKGKTYTVKLEVNDEIINSDDISVKIEQDKSIIKCINKKLKNGILELKFKASGKSTAIVSVESDNYSNYFKLYAHKFGIITYENYFGKCNGDIVIPISIIIIQIYILYLLIKTYIFFYKKDMYQYKNISYLGLIIFWTFSILNHIFTLINYQGLLYTIEQVITLCSSFSNILLPVVFIISIIITLSNIILVRNEGFKLKNLLGMILGIFLCFITILPYIINDILQSATWVNVHNINGFALYIQTFIETLIFIVLSYLECILLGTIILGIKSAKYIPAFDKDFIIILGCMINKDGSLTNLLKSRVDRAIEFRNMQLENTNKDLIFVPSGGQGNDEVIPEAQAMKNYLLEKGINENAIIIEDKSKNTYENIKFSYAIINDKKKDSKIAFSTTNYHVFRAGSIASKQNIDIEGIGAKTKTYFWINAFIREFIATLFYEKKKHISFISFVMIILLLIVIFLYFSNIL